MGFRTTFGALREQEDDRPEVRARIEIVRRLLSNAPLLASMHSVYSSVARPLRGSFLQSLDRFAKGMMFDEKGVERVDTVDEILVCIRTLSTIVNVKDACARGWVETANVLLDDAEATDLVLKHASQIDALVLQTVLTSVRWSISVCIREGGVVPQTPCPSGGAAD